VSNPVRAGLEGITDQQADGPGMVTTGTAPVRMPPDESDTKPIRKGPAHIKGRTHRRKRSLVFVAVYVMQ
jgi:hypothetical protein